MPRLRLAVLSLAAASAAIIPATAFAQNGADDPAPHNAPGLHVAGADDLVPHIPGADDTTPHVSGSKKKSPAKARSRVKVAGSCTAGSRAKISLKARNGRVEAEFEVDQNKAGVPWKVTMKANGTLVVSKTAVTSAPSGSFEVKTRVANTPGTDTVLGTATSPSGETCTAQASL
jgi:hypothetical protein